MLIFNSTFIVPVTSKSKESTFPKMRIFSNCSLTESSELESLTCFQNAQIALKRHGKLGEVTKIDSYLNFTGFMLELNH
jgi:hypothetical protein